MAAVAEGLGGAVAARTPQVALAGFDVNGIWSLLRHCAFLHVVLRSIALSHYRPPGFNGDLPNANNVDIHESAGIANLR